MKIKKIIFILILFVLIIPSVEAKEVSAKYEYIQDDSIYSQKITDKETKIDLDSFNISLIDELEKYQNNYFKIIPVTEENQISRIKEYIKNDKIEKIYYLLLEDSAKKEVSFDNVKIRLNNNQNNKMYTVNNEGRIIDNTNETKQDIKILNNNYIVITADSNIKKINYVTNGNGAIILDGEIISNSGEYTFKSNRIIIRSDSGYGIESALLNDEDILDKIENGFFDIDDIDNINLKINFAKENEQNLDNNYNFSGQVIYNGKPLQNAYIELHSTKLTTTTDEYGNFYFDNISLGNHSITISYDDKVIGYSQFTINSKTDNNLELIHNSNEKVIIDGDNIDLTLLINDNYDITIKNKDKLSDNNSEKSNLIYYLISILLIIILSIIIYIIYRKNKSNNC